MPDRNSVQLFAAVILALLTTACATSGAVPRPFPGAATVAGEPTAPGPVTAAAPVAPRAPAAPIASAPAEAPADRPAGRFEPSAVIQTALGFRGIPYRNGGTDPSGFDCSGFVQYVFAQHGLGLPRSVREQFVFGDDVEIAEAHAGDLIYFATEGEGPSHVGMIVDGDEFVHAPSSRGVVRIERFDTRYWAQRVVAVKRLR